MKSMLVFTSGTVILWTDNQLGGLLRANNIQMDTHEAVWPLADKREGWPPYKVTPLFAATPLSVESLIGVVVETYPQQEDASSIVQ